MRTKSILIGSPVRQKPAILAAFLQSLDDLDTEGMDIRYCFVDDNTDEESRGLLIRFEASHPGVEILRNGPHGREYRTDELTHHWTEPLIRIVAEYRDRILRRVLHEPSWPADTSVFLVDSDVVLQPKTLQRLVSLDKDIVSEIWWTQWEPGSLFLPNVWAGDNYQILEKGREEVLDEAAENERTLKYLSALRNTLPRRVGGLCGATLISRRAIEAGARFAEIDNLPYLGEDRHFCVRARALGLELWVDTRYPALHLYRESDIVKVPAFRARAQADYVKHPRVTLSMVVRNEADRWLRQTLRAARPCITDAVVIDDASTDDTIAVIERELAGLPLSLHRNDRPRFANEIDLRRQQWDACVATNPDWLLILDADEVLEDRAAQVIPELVRNQMFGAWGFHLHDMWRETHYREDEHWSAHMQARAFLVRYQPDYLYLWNETAQHCGRMPASATSAVLTAAVNLRVKHMGWSTVGDRHAKYDRYMRLDPHGSRAQYDSILDANPRLVLWEE